MKYPDSIVRPSIFVANNAALIGRAVVDKQDTKLAVIRNMNAVKRVIEIRSGITNRDNS